MGIVVHTCFENPLKNYAVEFLTEVLTFKRRTLIPVTTFFGAYRIATRYLKIPRLVVKKVLVRMLKTGSPSLYPNIPLDKAEEALDIAATYDIESWDGYLVALTQSVGAKIIYTLDKELGKVREISV